jgi:hypothetical protein
MGSWRLVGSVAAVLATLAIAAAVLTTPLLVVPPLAAAAVVLLGSALAVDYFGLARRRVGWSGLAEDPRQVWLRARMLERRFARERRSGSPRCGWTARSLLLALAAADRLGDADEVVDFLAAEAIYGRVCRDATADALRAVALAELGRAAQARRLCAALHADRRARTAPVVAYAAARVAARERRFGDALAHVDAALSRRAPAGVRRDLRILRACLLAAVARPHDAARELGELSAAGHRGQVERLAERACARGDTAVALAARAALAEASPYR